MKINSLVTSMIVLMLSFTSFTALAASKRAINKEKEIKLTPLEQGAAKAAETCDNEAMKFFLSKGVNPNLKVEPFKESLLSHVFSQHMGGIEPCIPVIKTLLESKANPNTYNDNKVSHSVNAVIQAAATDFYPKQILETFKDYGGDINAGSKCLKKHNDCIEGVNSLMMLIRGGALIRGVEEGFRRGSPQAWQVVEWDHFNYVLDNTDINAADSNGRTALHYAIERGVVNIGARLIKAGAMKDAKDKSGVTPFDLAVKSGDSQWIKLFQ